MDKYLDFSWVGNFVTRDTILGHPLDDVFSFRTAKVVRIQDRLLGGADLVIRTGLAVFVVFVLLMAQKGYVEREPVVGTATFTLDGDFRGVNSSKLEYCSEHPCRYVDAHVLRGGGGADENKGQLFVTTLMSEREQTRACEDDAEICSRNSAFKTEKDGRLISRHVACSLRCGVCWHALASSQTSCGAMGVSRRSGGCVRLSSCVAWC